MPNNPPKDEEPPEDESRSEVMEEFLTVSEIASALKVPSSWVYERTRRRGADRIPHFKLGKYLRFRPAAVRTWLRGLEEL